MRRARRVCIAVAALGLGTAPLAASPASAAPCPTFGAPQVVGQIRDPALNEISGLVASRAHRRTLWVHEDNLNPEQVTAVSMKGATKATVQLAGAENKDWEDIAFSEGAVWVGDIGDNFAERNWIRVYWFPEPPNLTSTSVTPLSATFRYPPNNSPDAEALIVDGGNDELFVITKKLGESRVFRGDLSGIVDGEERTLSLAVNDLTIDRVTAADLGTPGVLVKNDISSEGWLYPWTASHSVEDALAGAPCRVPVGPGESIGFNKRGTGYYTVPEGVRPALRFAPKSA
jgi:hypothetical protein